MVEGPGAPGALDTLWDVARALAGAGARYFVGGSFASTVQGIPRSTRDVDLVADLAAERTVQFVGGLPSGFYADEERIRDGILRRASFNVVDLRNGFKADVYLLGDEPFDRSQLERAQPIEVDPGRVLPFASAEDTVLQKLRWFRLGGGVSERQWLDALGVLEVQGAALDSVYLARWAQELGLGDLLERARRELG